MHKGARRFSFSVLLAGLALCALATGCATWRWTANRAQEPDRFVTALDQLITQVSWVKLTSTKAASR